ncbi:hypothetical protein [Maribellus mangrovi]|uniref:hypothetical protein n=1 Tax=Maribellus mangrovi TaxID=3133146 RepID=UPI0030EBAB46
MEKQSFNLSADLLGGYTGIFIKIVMAIILIYAFIMLVNFFRDKFLKTENFSRDPQITDLLSILNKLCVLAGFGFVLGNVLQALLNQATNSRSALQIRGMWDYLTFGVILIFIGFGFKVAKKVHNKENRE